MGNLLLAVIYLAFISLGLPDAVLGSAWPVMYGQFDVPVSFAGIVSMIISAGTIVSSLLSDRLTLRFGTGRVTVCSVAVTAVALAGFSFSPAFWVICLWAVPYGLGAGAVDAALNNYVALHYASRHMSWLHCMWGIGASLGPYIMGFVLTGGMRWPVGYQCIAVLQVALTLLLFLSLPMWKTRSDAAAVPADASDGPSDDGGASYRPLGLREVLAIPGVKSVLVTFFCYSALEGTAGLWAASFMALGRGVDAVQAASWGALFYLGITVGRGVSGFLTMRFDDSVMIRIGQVLVAVGVIVMLLPFGNLMALAGLVIVGLGCAPIYPCIIHSTPAYFGADRSQAIIGVQMAFAYCGGLLAPPVFGWLANHVTITLYPWYLAAILILMVAMHENLLRTRGRSVANR